MCFTSFFDPVARLGRVGPQVVEGGAGVEDPLSGRLLLELKEVIAIYRLIAFFFFFEETANVFMRKKAKYRTPRRPHARETSSTVEAGIFADTTLRKRK